MPSTNRHSDKQPSAYFTALPELKLKTLKNVDYEGNPIDYEASRSKMIE